MIKPFIGYANLNSRLFQFQKPLYVFRRFRTGTDPVSHYVSLACRYHVSLPFKNYVFGQFVYDRAEPSEPAAAIFFFALPRRIKEICEHDFASPPPFVISAPSAVSGENHTVKMRLRFHFKNSHAKLFQEIANGQPLKPSKMRIRLYARIHMNVFFGGNLIVRGRTH